MRKSLIYILFVLLILFGFQSCDFLRKLAGRPSSYDIEIKKQKIELALKREKEIADSIEREEKLRLAFIADSLSVLDSLKNENCFIRTQKETGRIAGGSLPARYWIVTGAFRNEENVRRRILRLNSSGFEAESVTLGTGLKLVITSPANSLRDIYSEYLRYKASDLSSPDVWIFDTAPVNEEQAK